MNQNVSGMAPGPLRLLQESEARFRSLVEGAPDGIYIQVQGRFVYVNLGACQLFGAKDPQELLNLPVLDRVHEDFRGVAREQLRQLTEKGARHPPLREVFLRLDGSEVPVEVTGVPFVHEGAQGSLSFVRDISARRKIEEHLLRNQRLESIGTLAAGIAHDLNNLLSPIIMGVDLLETFHATPDSLPILDEIKSSALRGTELAREVLALTGGVPGQQVDFSIKLLVDEMVALFRKALPTATRIHSQTSDTTLPVFGDPDQIRQVIANLMTNAVEAMPDGGELTLSACTATLDHHLARVDEILQPGPYVVVAISDTGVGMSDAVKNRIFEPFFTTKERGKGTGLGLSSAYSITRRHGGFIQVETKPAQGSTFKVYLPSANKSVQPGMCHRAKLPPSLLGHGELILLVDDDAAVLSITRQTLESAGYGVIAVADGPTAICQYVAHKDRIALVISDLLMPEMDGSSLSAVLHRMNPDICLVLTSGQPADRLSRHYAENELQDFLPKPYSAETLLGKVVGMLRNRKLPATAQP